MKDIYKANPLNPDVPKYCRQCGSPMVYGKRKKATGSFNKKTGEWTGAEEYTARCSKILKIWGRFKYHDDFLVIDSPHSGFTGGPHRTILKKGY